MPIIAKVARCRGESVGLGQPGILVFTHLVTLDKSCTPVLSCITGERCKPRNDRCMEVLSLPESLTSFCPPLHSSQSPSSRVLYSLIQESIYFSLQVWYSYSVVEGFFKMSCLGENPFSEMNAFIVDTEACLCGVKCRGTSSLLPGSQSPRSLGPWMTFQDSTQLSANTGVP